jgi:RimJ/RimL family protein N-acetyltransferase
MSKYFKKLVGERVYLSPWAGDDAEAELFATWVNDSKVTDGVGNTTSLYSVASEKQYVADVASKSSDDSRDFVILDNATNQPVGNCRIMKIDWLNQTAELGILIGEEKARGQGFGEETVKLLLDFGFNHLNLHNIYLCYYAGNIAAQKCYEKVGFREIGRKREAAFRNGERDDVVLMEFLAEEFRAKHGSAIKNKFLG